MTVLSGVKSFVLQKFWLPVAGKAGDYNVFNTSVYAVLFALAAAYIGYPLLERLDVDLDREFFLSITPYILLGSSVRVLEDLKLVDSFLLVTPFIYFVMFFLTVSLLAVTRYFYGKNYYRVFGGTGAVLLLATLALYLPVNPFPVLQASALLLLAASVLYLAARQLKPELAGYSFMVPVLAHYWDASTSSIVLIYGGTEKHLLARFFVDLLGPAGMFVMKSLVIVPVVYYIDQEMEDDGMRRYVLFLVALLGIALGTRNILSLIA